MHQFFLKKKLKKKLVMSFCGPYKFNYLLTITYKYMKKNKSNYKKLIQIFNVSFNFKIPFDDWSESKFVEFAKDFMSGNTEYYQDEYFMKNHYKIVADLLKNY